MSKRNKVAEKFDQINQRAAVLSVLRDNVALVLNAPTPKDSTSKDLMKSVLEKSLRGIDQITNEFIDNSDMQ